MNIANAKQQIKNAVTIYLQKDALGRYEVPLVHQRPIFLQGAPGLGKTAIMKQISEELGIGLVSYSMTHHTRQSAIGLPMIVEREFGGQRYSVSEYTMSEIIASVYECMERTGKKEGILFLDEINCISETLSPAMLLFLQYKVFGGHTLPDGWVVVTAGNPARYNKSVREFDAATLDRLKYLPVEPDYEIWKEYAVQRNVSRTILSFLDIRPDCFYVMETTVSGFSVVTPRSWEDLSQSIRMHERLQIEIDQNLIRQYLQNDAVARDFAVYYELYQKYRLAYDVDAIVAGTYNPETLEEARQARIDERLTLTGLLLEKVLGDMQYCTTEKTALLKLREQLVAQKEVLEATGTQAVKVFDEMQHALRTSAEQGSEAEQAGWNSAASLLHKMQKAAMRNTGKLSVYEVCRSYYATQVAELEQHVKKTQAECGNLLKFLQQAFGDGNELSMAVSDLTAKPEASSFIGQFLSLEFFEASSRLQLHKKEKQLQDRIQLALGEEG